MFLLNSCLSLFSAAASLQHPFSRSYGVILPSSLTMLLPPALGFSPHPPVSVYGTGTYYTIAAFLDSPSTGFATYISLPITLSDCAADLPTALLTSLRPVFALPGPVSFLCPHSSDHVRCRNMNLLSIDYGSLPRLRSRLTQGRSALPWNPWIFGHDDSHIILATHSGILSSQNSTLPCGSASAL